MLQQARKFAQREEELLRRLAAAEARALRAEEALAANLKAQQESKHDVPAVEQARQRVATADSALASGSPDNKEHTTPQAGQEDVLEQQVALLEKMLEEASETLEDAYIFASDLADKSPERPPQIKTHPCYDGLAKSDKYDALVEVQDRLEKQFLEDLADLPPPEYDSSGTVSPSDDEEEDYYEYDGGNTQTCSRTSTVCFDSVADLAEALQIRC